MRNYITKLALLLALFANANVWADAAVASSGGTQMLVHIQPLEYSSPIILWHPYTNYWFYQGPVVEHVAMPKLSQAFGNVSVCEANQSGKVLVWLQPKMFYNPQVQIFYGKVTANVYTGMGKFIASYEGESALHGFIDIRVEDWIEKSYTLAVDKMVEKMKADSALQNLLTNTNAPDGDTPCSMISLLPTPKIRALSF